MAKVNPNDPRMPYVQIADDIRAAIETGKFEPGSRLPSIRALAEEYGVAGETVQRAIRVLRAEQRVTSHQGRALFVTAPPETSTEPDVSGDVAQKLDQLTRELRELRSRVDRLEAPRSDT